MIDDVMTRVDLDSDYNAPSQSVGPTWNSLLRYLPYNYDPQFFESIQAAAHRNEASCRHRY